MRYHGLAGWIGVVAAAACAGAGGCGGNQDPAGAVELADRIRAEDYTTWARPPGWGARAPSSGPHGQFVDIWVNDVMDAALTAGVPLADWPEGAIIVKQAYGAESLRVIVAMEKRADGWFWASWKPDWTVRHSGSPDHCTGCHSRGDDFVRAFPLP